MVDSVVVMSAVDHPPITAWFDDDCGLCSTVVRRLRTHTDPAVTWRPDRELDTGPGSAIVVTVDGAGTGGRSATRLEGVAAIAALLGRTSRFGRTCGRALGAPGIRSVAGVVYRWVARHRSGISSRLGLRAGCDLPRGASGESNA